MPQGPMSVTLGTTLILKEIDKRREAAGIDPELFMEGWPAIIQGRAPFYTDHLFLAVSQLGAGFLDVLNDAVGDRSPEQLCSKPPGLTKGSQHGKTLNLDDTRSFQPDGS